MSVIPLRGADEAPDSVRERAIRLFQFLCEYTLLRTRSVRTTDAYEEVIWLADVPDTPGCRCAVLDAGGRDPEIWMEIAQPRLEPPPEPPDLLIPWLRPGSVLDSGPEAPVLLDAIPIAEEEAAAADEEPEGLRLEEPEGLRLEEPEGLRPEEPEVMRLEEHPQVRWAFDQYLDRWRPWAEKDRVLRRQQRVYTDLFRLHQAQRRLGEAYEVVMGLGHLSWRTPSGAAVRRHLVVAQTDVRFDADAGVITVVAAVDGARPELEQDMLEPNERPGADEVERIVSSLTEVGDDIFGDPAVRRILRAWVHGASSRGRFENELAPQESVTDQPLVRLAPALLLRRRNERSILQALEAIVEQLQEGSSDLPEGVRQLVQIVEEGEAEEEAEDASRSEVLLPLPANEEQLDIVRRLRSRPGVLVQGPPGTGKSHTIANLVAHLLAQGQRVLVTSHTARALEVLRDKVPKEIRELAVVVLGNDVSGRDELRASVSGIQHRYSSWNPRRSEERVSSLRQALDEARAAEAAAVGRLSALREGDSHRHNPGFGDYRGTSQEIAAELHRQAADHGWIVAGGDLGQPCPLSPEETSELRELARDLDAAAEELLALAVPDPATLPSPEALAELVEGEREAAAASAEVERYRRHPGYGPLRASSAEARTAFWSAAHELAASRRALERRPEPWLSKAADEVLVGYAGRWHELERFTGETLDAVQPGLSEVAHAQVTGLGNRPLADLLADARPLLEHLRQGQGWGRGPFQPPVVKQARYIADQVRVDGLSSRDLAVLERLVRWLEVQASLDRLDAEWSSIAEVSAGSPSARAARYSDLLSALRAVLLVERRLGAIEAAAADVPNLRSQDWQDTDALNELIGAAAAADRDVAWADAAERLAGLSDMLDRLGPAAHPAVAELAEAVRDRDQERYGKAHEALAEVAGLRERQHRRDELLGRLREAAPGVAAALASGPDLQDQRLATLHTAWDWARADAWLRDLADPSEQRRLERQLDEGRREVERLSRDLAAELAWAESMGRLTETERQHLVAWETAVRRIGKGTGKTAPAWRARAREAMQGCRTAVPAWIMPIFKVAETVDIVPEAFDVVIVDEASQSGPEALFLQYLARKVIVVGDDQQISPSNIGIERDKVELLNEQYLKDVPLGSFFNADNSLFDLAAIRYRDRVVLREHFRCMPEIIQFSSRLCYRDQPLIPLRQFGSDRLKPAIRVRHVAGGYRAEDVNEPEAVAIVDQVIACLQDRAYDGKTFGVVSLVGPGQAEYIRRLLAHRVDPGEIERRQIVCGEAYAFQGDERDVMFLSLVQAPTEGRRMAALTRDADRRRFNVAASRARDQMWLFHTATLDDLNRGSVAYQLLDYCLNPGVEPSPPSGISLDELAWRAGDADRGVRPPQPFESWFEAEVFLRLAERGYRVIPRYPMADYLVDLVVEGRHGRLAVKCDGDAWPGAEAFDRDAHRQRMLTRCGLHFVRIRGAAFYRDPEATLEPLWAELQARGITADPALTARG